MSEKDLTVEDRIKGEVLREIEAERQRQIDKEGWSLEHDNGHDLGELARAAVCYCLGHSAGWPWDIEWWKPTDHRRNLIKAAALIVAEIERLDRKVSVDKGI